MTRRNLRALILAAAAILLLYFAVTAYAGYRVAGGIRQAERSNLLVRTGAEVLGPKAIERLALKRAELPSWLTASPTFWLALRRSQ